MTNSDPSILQKYILISKIISNYYKPGSSSARSSDLIEHIIFVAFLQSLKNQPLRIEQIFNQQIANQLVRTQHISNQQISHWLLRTEQISDQQISKRQISNQQISHQQISNQLLHTEQLRGSLGRAISPAVPQAHSRAGKYVFFIFDIYLIY